MTDGGQELSPYRWIIGDGGDSRSTRHHNRQRHFAANVGQPGRDDAGNRLGLGCLFTPINLAALASLKGVEIAQGASLLNLTRQLGGSFGIAYLSTHLSDKLALHDNTLIAHAYTGNPAFDIRLQAIQQGLIARGYDVASAHQAALEIIARAVRAQASVMSYNDAFLFIGLAVLIVSPCVFLLRSGPPSAPISMDH